MINSFSKLLTRSLTPIFQPQITTTLKHSFASDTKYLFHRFDIDALSDKWHIDFSYSTGTLNKKDDQDKVRPNPFAKTFTVKFVEKSQRFVKGRPQYRMEMFSNEAIQLSQWNPNKGKFQIIRTDLYKEQVLIVEQQIKTTPEPMLQAFNIPVNIKQYPVKLYKFSFYNNKISDEKSKYFYLSYGDLNLLQETLRSSFDILSFNQSKEEYEIWRLERQIVKKEMIINREEQSQGKQIY